MIFAQEAVRILEVAGLDPEAVDREPVNDAHRRTLDAIFFGRASAGELPRGLIERLLDRERSDGWQIYRPESVGLAVRDETALCRELTRRYASLLHLMQSLFGARRGTPVDVDRLLVCVPSSRQDAYVYRYDGRDYIVLTYGLISLIRFTGESLLWTHWLRPESLGSASLVLPLVERLQAARPAIARLAARRPDTLPWVGGVLPNYEFLDSCCCLGFALFFVCAHEAVHIQQQHATLFDPRSEAYPDSGSVRRFCTSYDIAAHQALELMADERATYYADALDGWSNMSFGTAAYILAVGLGNTDAPERLRLARIRADNLAAQHLGEGGPSAFGIGAVAMYEVAKILKDLGDDVPAEAVDWSGFLTDFTRIARFLQMWLVRAYSEPIGDRTPQLAQPQSRYDQPPDALGPAREAVRILRNLAEQNRRWRPMLALSLTNLGMAFARTIEFGRGTGDFERRKIDAMRESKSQDRADAETGHYAASLTALAGVFRDLLGGDERLASNEEAVAILQELAAEEPSAYDEQLAGALAMLAETYADFGQVDDARTALLEAVARLRAIPDAGHAIRADLAAMTALLARFGVAGDN